VSSLIYLAILYVKGGEKLEDWKIKISVLWLFVDVAFLGYFILKILEPGNLQQFLSTGEISNGMKMTSVLLLFFAVCMLVPLIMAFLSLNLKYSTNRWSNIIVGVVFVALKCVDLIEDVTKLSAWAMLMTLSGVVALALIVWYAWKSRQKV
jgi:peptidoglycan biosynthesis protein MviN/MurJ (putative lipid II flippase)